MIRPPQADAERWKRLEAVFADAIELQGAARAAFLSSHCSDDPWLLDQLRRLLDAHDTLESGDTPSTGDVASAGFLGTLDSGRVDALLQHVAPASPEGGTVGRYRIIRRIGQGGMGVVYLAHDPLLDRQVALKLLPAWLSGDAAANRRLMAEARAASALDDPHIATVYEAGETDDGRLFLAMAYCPGETLRERLTAGALSEDAARNIALGIVRGLAAAHARGIVHRDIKPENIVVGPDGRVRILDFGIARAAEAVITRVHGTPGTVAYMSPEQTRGDVVDGRSDLWSLGVVLYEMLAGRRPFPGDAGPAVIHAIRTDEVTPLSTVRSGLSGDLADIAHALLEKDPALRPPTADAVIEALETGGAGASRFRLAARRRRRWVSAAGALVLLGLLSAGVTHLRPGETISLGEGRPWVLLADVAGDGEVQPLFHAIREALSVDLQQSGVVAVLPRSLVGGTLQRMGLADTVQVTGARAREVAERAGASAVISVEVSRLGSQYVLTGRALRPANAEELFAVRSTAEPDRLLEGVEDLSRSMRRRLGETRDDVRRSPSLPAVTTTSLEALRLYADAERFHLTDPSAALTAVNASIAADPGFAMAHRMAGTLAYNQLRFADADVHFTRAYELRDRLTDRERWHVEAFYRGKVELEPRRAADALQLVLQRYPDDVLAASNLVNVLHSWLAEHEAGHAAALRSLDLEPWSPVALNNALYSALLVGQPAQADSIGRLAAERGYPMIALRGELAGSFVAGDYQRTAALCDSLLDGDPPQPAQPDDYEFCGSADVASGRLRQGIGRLQLAERSYRESGRHRNIAHAVQGIAAARMLQGDDAGAAAAIAAIIASLSADDVGEPDRFINRTNLQVQAALLGRQDLADAIGQQYPPYPRPGHWFGVAGDALVSAATAVAAGNGAGALQQLHAGWPTDRDAIGWRIWHALLQGMAHEQLGQWGAAATSYARAADPRLHGMRTMTKNRLFLPVALQRLEHAALRAGDARGSEAAHRQLESLWHGADADALRGRVRLGADLR
jgi:eukaryotic-like serine/threonine-protein kinase